MRQSQCPGQAMGCQELHSHLSCGCRAQALVLLGQNKYGDVSLLVSLNYLHNFMLFMHLSNGAFVNDIWFESIYDINF